MNKRIARRAAAIGAGIALMLAAAAPASADLSYSPEALPQTLHCGAQTIELIKPTGPAPILVAQTADGTGVFFILRVTDTATGTVVFSLPDSALAGFASTQDLVTCTGIGPISGREVALLGFFTPAGG